MNHRVRHIHRAVLACGAAVAGQGRGGLHGLQVSTPDLPPVEHHWTPDVRRDTYSVSKSFVAIAIGIAQDAGLLELSDPLSRHLGHLAPYAAPGVESITIKQLLTMTSGIIYRWDEERIKALDDPAAAVVGATLGFAPGSGFAYRGADTYLLSRIIHACSGEDLRDFLVSRLFEPLGISTPEWQRCPRGFSLGAVG
ncbi:MAG TPA: serine hydrolase domain-containing protein, partial [Microlunatus sp.]|nr:serine hydrolase domain-containing protein [Microlunatus sp.]